MSGVQTSLTLTDGLSRPLQRMIRAMDKTIRVMERMDQTANNVNTRGLQQARREMQNASADLERLRASANRVGDTDGVRRLHNQFTNLPGPISRARESVRSFFSSFAGAAAAYLSIQGIMNGFKSFTSAADTYTSTSARLANINDGLQTQKELQDKIYQASQRSLSSYNDMASSVAKLNLLAADAFSSNDEAIRFSELMSKAFSVSGASTQERSAGMYQLTQAMASGKLQGDEFRSIMENAPLLAKAISDSMGVSMGELRKLSSEGVITADIIKNALFGAAEDIEGKFKAMPLTFNDAMTKMKNWGMTAFEPLFQRFTQFINSDAFGVLAGHAMTFVNLFTAGLGLVFDALEWVYNLMGGISSFFQENWSTFGPIIYGIVGALAAYVGIMTALRVATMLGAIAQWAMNTAATFHAAAAMAATGATFAQTAAQHGLNAAMYAFPGTWILLLFVAAIALVIFALVTWAEQTATVIGFIAGLFTSLLTTIYNVFASAWNYIATFAEFLINIFVDPTYAVQKLFYDMVKGSIDSMASLAGSFDKAASVLGNVFVAGANIAISAINGIISALNMIPGVDIGKIDKISASAGTGLSQKMIDFANNLEAPKSSKNVVSIPRMELKSLPDAFNAGNEFGSNLSLKASDKLTGALHKVTGLLKGPNMKENPFNPESTLGDIALNNLGNNLANSPGAKLGKDAANPTGGKLDSIGKINDDINIADEDLKMLLDLADNRSIQQISNTLSPTVTFTGDMTIREEADIDKIITKINKSFENEMVRSTEGVYTT